MNSNTEIKPSAAEPAETSEQQKSRMSPVMSLHADAGSSG